MIRHLLAVSTLTIAGFMPTAAFTDEVSQEKTFGIQVDNAWVRATISPKVKVSAIYLDMTNISKEDDVLLSAETAVADMAQIHTVAENEQGVMSMSEVDGVILPVGETVSLGQGGDHIMLMGLTEQLTAGESIDVTLNFEQAGMYSITVPIKSTN